MKPHVAVPAHFNIKIIEISAKIEMVRIYVVLNMSVGNHNASNMMLHLMNMRYNNLGEIH